MRDVLERKRVRDSVQSCRECALFMGCGGPIPFYGPSPCEIAIVGEAPGKYEDIQRRPFVGPSGQLARRWLEAVSIDPESVAWLNVVSCYPSRTPTGREVAACRKNLSAQLAVIRPTFTLVVGGVACSAWHPLLRIGDLRGRWWDIEGDGKSNWEGSLALATWHPAAVLRNRNLYKQALEDVTYFAMVAKGEIGLMYSDKCVMCGGLYDKLENGIAWCLKHYNQKHGISGLGRKPQFRKRKNVKDQRLIETVYDD